MKNGLAKIHVRMRPFSTQVSVILLTLCLFLSIAATGHASGLYVSGGLGVSKLSTTLELAPHFSVPVDRVGAYATLGLGYSLFDELSIEAGYWDAAPASVSQLVSLYSGNPTSYTQVTRDQRAHGPYLALRPGIGFAEVLHLNLLLGASTVSFAPESLGSPDKTAVKPILGAGITCHLGPLLDLSLEARTLTCQNVKVQSFTANVGWKF